MTHKIRGTRAEGYAYYVNKLRQNVGLDMTSNCEYDVKSQGPSLWGGHVPPNFWTGGHNIFCPPNIL